MTNKGLRKASADEALIGRLWHEQCRCKACRSGYGTLWNHNRAIFKFADVPVQVVLQICCCGSQRLQGPCPAHHTRTQEGRRKGAQWEALSTQTCQSNS